jgi:hypothetical protein
MPSSALKNPAEDSKNFGARKATVLIIASKTAKPPLSAAPSPTQSEMAPRSIFDFVKAFVETGNSGANGEEIDFYAEKVAYFDKGLVDRNFIASDIAKYHAKWPVRWYSMVAGPDATVTPKEGMYSGYSSKSKTVKSVPPALHLTNCWLVRSVTGSLSSESQKR